MKDLRTSLIKINQITASLEEDEKHYPPGYVFIFKDGTALNVASDYWDLKLTQDNNVMIHHESTGNFTVENRDDNPITYIAPMIFTNQK